MLPKEAIEDFKKIFKQKYSMDLTDKEALQRASNLFGLYESVYIKKSTKFSIKSSGELQGKS